MRTRMLVWATIALTLAAGVGDLRGDPDKEVKPDRVVDLIRQLGDNKFSNREAASKALAKIGEPALAALRKAADDSDDAEIRKRAGDVVKVIVEVQKRDKLARLDKSFVNETEWLVAGIKGGRPDVPHPVPWVFHRDGTVQAGDLWKGTWEADGENAVIVNTGYDECRVVFQSARRFEAFKEGELYRQGSSR